MSLKEKLAKVKTEEEFNRVLETVSLDDLKVFQKEVGRVELLDESLDGISGGSGYKDVLDILASLFGVRSEDLLGKMFDKASGK